MVWASLYVEKGLEQSSAQLCAHRLASICISVMSHSVTMVQVNTSTSLHKEVEEFYNWMERVIKAVARKGSSPYAKINPNSLKHGLRKSSRPNLELNSPLKILGCVEDIKEMLLSTAKEVLGRQKKKQLWVANDVRNLCDQRSLKKARKSNEAAK